MNYSKSDVILLPYPFTDLTARKVRPAVVAGSGKAKYEDIFVVPLTSKVNNLSEDEFPLKHWKDAGLNVPTAIKRGCILVDASLVIKKVGTLSKDDLDLVDKALKSWLEL
ncbi:MAG TPA: type II toxin-antitoxin system PemK/MazF family toxin [Spirochaetota bacterium]|nr:type II toxin-antitoxin system PemK/MazF family toxin [Smithellaceae bacterium]HPL18449.1 type II toxin-antitoxin system PemK/MazF family toxin [Spirochaetota bacterium]